MTIVMVFYISWSYFGCYPATEFLSSTSTNAVSSKRRVAFGCTGTHTKSAPKLARGPGESPSIISAAGSIPSAFDP